MSDVPRGPRLILEEPAMAPAPRLDFGWEQAVAPIAPPVVRRRWGGIGLGLAGLAVLGVGLSALEVANFVGAQFERGWLQGWLTLAVAVLGFGLLGTGALREIRGLSAIRAVDRARAAFARTDLAVAQAEALRWAGGIADAAPMQPALREAPDVATLRALLEAGPLRTLEVKVAALGRAAALQAFAITAVSPSPALDALVFAWRGLRLIRQVAALHGLRPGLMGTLALLQRTVLDAAAVAAIDVAVDAAARALLSNRLVEHVAGEAAAGAVAARRMLRLARAAGEACRILPRP